MISLHDRYRGAMVGVLCGDALGAPYETWPGVAIRMDVERRGGLFLFDYDDPWEKDGVFPKGKPTDDSEMTAVLAEHLISDEHTSQSHLYDRFRRVVIEKKSALCALPAYGFGGTTRRALAEPTYATSFAAEEVRPPIPSNGALMRTVPVALRYRGLDPFERAHYTIAAAFITHQHPDAVQTAVLYVEVLEGILNGKSYAEAIEDVIAYDARCGGANEERIAACFGSPAERPPIPKGFGGGALYTLSVAHWAVATSSSFEEGMTKAITIGRDVDTYGAVAGGLLGALYGATSIPRQWYNGLLGRDRMITLADQLFKASEGA